MTHPASPSPLPARSRLGVVLTGLAALTLAQDALGATGFQAPPRTCADIRAVHPDAGDGEDLLYLEGDVTRAWAAWCHDMAGTPTEYLTLAQTGPDTNVSEYFVDRAAESPVRTAYTRLRFNPRTLIVDTSDQRFATSTGELLHSPTPVTSMPYATAMACGGNLNQGTSSIDLRGTPFAVMEGQLRPGGYMSNGYALHSQQDQRVDIRGGGLCGWTGPLNSFNPYNQNGSLLHLNDIALPRHKSCAELRQAQPEARDGTYVLYVENNPTRPWLGYCHDMAGTPTDYLTLAQTHPAANYSEYLYGGKTLGTTVRTVYTRLRFNPYDRVVDTSDQRFATSTGRLVHNLTDTVVTSMPYASAMSCTGSGWEPGTASIDLRGTAFSVYPSQFVAGGTGARGKVLDLGGHRHLRLTGGGYCGWNSLIASHEPFNQNGLPLALTHEAF